MFHLDLSSRSFSSISVSVFADLDEIVTATIALHPSLRTYSTLRNERCSDPELLEQPHKIFVIEARLLYGERVEIGSHGACPFPNFPLLSLVDELCFGHEDRTMSMFPSYLICVQLYQICVHHTVIY
jgi:hypothetical protein